MSSEIKKIILPAAGLGTRFLPLSKAVPKQFLPLADAPMVSYVVDEAREAGMEEVIFVVNEASKNIAGYFQKDAKFEEVLEERGAKDVLEKLKNVSAGLENVAISSVVQPLPRGDGDAVLRAEKAVGKGACAVAFFDDVFSSKTPPLSQLLNIFKTSQKTVVGLKKVSPEKLPFYGVAGVEKIASNIYKIKEITEKPPMGQAPSDLAMCGRYVFTEEIFHYLKKTQPNAKGEIILAEAVKLMLADGKMVYGCEIEGEWLECGNTQEWLKSNLTLCLRHPKYGPVLKEWIKKIK
ncbi:MAG: UTP--glucose-1-phosphate uridylyltransferase [Candidatus Pacebacteria bacterium]|nr:UTP--glucose-1-phosphate uridylyltransferase [Candidatus Paceibacterota bacterium]